MGARKKMKNLFKIEETWNVGCHSSARDDWDSVRRCLVLWPSCADRIGRKPPIGIARQLRGPHRVTTADGKNDAVPTGSIDKMNTGASTLHAAVGDFTRAAQGMTDLMSGVAKSSDALTRSAGSMTAATSALEAIVADYRTSRDVLDRKHWSNAGPIRKIFKEAFASVGSPYFNPHSFRKTLALLGGQLCRSPEESKLGLRIWATSKC